MGLKDRKNDEINKRIQIMSNLNEIMWSQFILMWRGGKFMEEMGQSNVNLLESP
jgi:hypothetical protein